MDATFTVPRITTPRLVLRELRMSDFEAYAANQADPVAMKHLTGVVDQRTSWRLFAAAAGGWALSGAGWWAVERIAEPGYVGTVGAFYRETQFGRGNDADIEIGWSFVRSFWGQGFAREAARAVLIDAFARHPVKRVIAHIDVENQASRRVSDAIGMTYEGTTDFYGAKLALYVTRRGDLHGSDLQRGERGNEANEAKRA